MCAYVLLPKAMQGAEAAPAVYRPRSASLSSFRAG